MTDLEMTRLCAEAMELPIEMRYHAARDCQWPITPDENGVWQVVYAPLHNDAQAMALVKRMRLNVFSAFCSNDVVPDDSAYQFRVIGNHRDYKNVLHETSASGNNLNRAIVECVAKMQKEKAPAPENMG